MTNFSREQLSAIAIDRLGEDACIVAGPGSGKTTVLVERYKQLVESGIEANRILAITFTERAASNMKRKLAALPALQGKMETANVSTVHGFCLKLIRENAIEAGVDPAASILDEGKGVLMRRRCLNQALDEVLETHREATRALMRSLAGDVSGLLDVYDAMRSAGVPADELKAFPAQSCAGLDEEVQRLVESVRSLRSLNPKQRGHLEELFEWHKRLLACTTNECRRDVLKVSPFNLTKVRHAPVTDAVKQIKEHAALLLADVVTCLHEREREVLIHILERFDALYSAAKRESGVLDFSDLEAYAVKLLAGNNSIRDRVRLHFRQIMMDEFQDTNPLQAQLLELLRGPDRFYAVGDINQSIFGFRYASPEVFRDYRDLVTATGKHHVELVENWRSRPEILLAVETILEGHTGIEPRPLKAAKKPAVKRDPSIEVIAVEPPGGVDGVELESQWVARRILELRGTLRIADRDTGQQRIAEFRDMAVLVRNSSVFPAFAEAFAKANVPCEQSRRKGFYESREALDLAHLLRAIANPRDEVSLVVVLRSPLVAVSDEAILHLETIDKNLGEALRKLSAEEEARFDAVDLRKLLLFRRTLDDLRSAHPFLKIDRLLMRALDQCGYTWAPGTAEGATVERFLELARSAGVSLTEFNEEIEQLREVDSKEAEAELDSGRNAVRMMTAHSAKGLEFPVVFVASMNKGVDTKGGAISFTPGVGLGAKWNDPDSKEGLSDSFHLANCKINEAKDKEEANRLLYVALTRAEEHLVLSYSKESKMNWAKRIRDLIVEPNVSVFGVEKIVEIAHPGGKVFRARVVRAATPPGPMQSGLFYEEPEQAAVLPRPAVSDQHDSGVTVTALATYDSCPRRYYLANSLGFQPVRGMRLADIADADAEERELALDAGELGKQVHALLAGESFESPDPAARRLAEAFRASELGARARRAERAEREFAFLVAVEDVVVRGQIDLWFEEAGELVLVDYKTNDVEAAGVEDLARRYALQIHLYALTLERLTGRRPARAYLHFLKPDIAVEITPDPEAAIRAVQSLAAAQENCDFPLHTGRHCHRCPFYKGLCPAGSETVNFEPLPTSLDTAMLPPC
ncbi:MAG: UvrD-helicase domain-containing protein [Acidobacteriota bacterium]|nr:UvrD-helicase domain-containing protein [Acidobacteriota bacterium]